MKKFKQTTFLKLEKKDAQVFLNIIKKNLKYEHFIDKGKRIFSERGFVFFPLIEDKDKVNRLTKYIEDKFSFEIINLDSYYPLNNSQTIESILKDKLPLNTFNLIPKSYDIIGHIAIVEFNRFKDLSYRKASRYKKEFAKALLITNNNIKSIYEKKSEIKGKFRLRKLKLLMGQDNPKAVYRENNCTFNINVKKAFFSPRLAYERKRVANYNFKDHELIIDMFAGVGPFSIQLAKFHDVQIYAFDINPVAYKYLKKNIILNKTKGKINPFNINVKSLLNSTSTLGNELKHKANRVIMNLPEKSLNFIKIACFLMKLKGGIIHNYQFVNKPQSKERAVESLKGSLEKYFWTIKKISDCRIVKSYSPEIDLVVIDSIIEPLN